MAKAKINGVIISNDSKWIYDLFEMSSTCPKDIESVIDTSGKDEEIEVVINSPGGSVYAGSEIYALLNGCGKKVTGKIMGVAASAASVIAMACKPLAIAPTAQVMIHNVSSVAQGNFEDLQQEANVCRGWDKSIANAYQLKTGMSQTDLLALMDNTTWMTAQEALQNKFVDEIMFDEGNNLVNTVGLEGMIPEKVISKLRNILIDPGILKDLVNLTNTKPKEENEEMEIKNVEELKAQLPDIHNAVYLAGIKAEQERLKSFEALNGKVDPEFLTEVKFQDGMTADKASLQAISEGKLINMTYIAQAQQDAEGVNKVGGTPNDNLKPDEVSATLAHVKNVAENTIKGGRK